jgi:hypothetical protein
MLLLQVSVPKNTALIITREKGGYLNIMRSPISAAAPDPIQQEVSTCLEAISRSMSTKSSAWVAKKQSRSGESLREDSLGATLSGGEGVAVRALCYLWVCPRAYDPGVRTGSWKGLQRHIFLARGIWH